MEKALERFDRQDCKPRVTPVSKKWNYTSDAEMIGCHKTERGSQHPHLSRTRPSLRL